MELISGDRIEYSPLPSAEGRHLAVAALASLLFHVLIFTGASFHRNLWVSKPDKITVTLVSPPEQPRQIVSPSESPPEPPIQPTKLLSEHDSRAEKETLRRGDPLSQPEPVKSAPKPRVPAKPERPAERRSDPPTAPPDQPDPKQLTKLRLSDDQLRQAISHVAKKPSASSNKNSRESDDDALRAQKLEQAEPFERASTTSVFRNRGGAADLLSEIPDGDVTLLNAKADQFAVFVRRVALQVFGALRKLNWQELSRSEIVRLKGYVTVEAVMNKEGKLLRVKMTDSSGSSRFDQITTRAANEGTWDQNPPAGAVAGDGNIHFVFKARSWSRMSPKGLNEQRWLMLGTGLL